MGEEESDEPTLNLSITANEAFKRDIKIVGQIPDDCFEKLCDEVKTEAGIEVDDAEQFYALWAETGLKNDDASNAVSVLNHLHDLAVKKEVPAELAANELIAFAEKEDIPGVASKLDQLIRLLSVGEQEKAAKEAAPFSEGVVPLLTRISGVVDLRGVYENGKSDELLGVVPAVLISMAVAQSDDKTINRIQFQMREDGLKNLIESLERYQKQLSALREAVGDSLKVYTLPE